MPYSSDVSAGTTILATQYNNLRKDAAGIIEVTAVGGGVSQYKAGYLNGSFEADHADCSAVATARAKGIFTENISGGASGGLQVSGEIVNGSWTWVAELDIWLSTNGNLTQTPPSIVSGAQLVKMGFPTSATSMIIKIEFLTP